MPKKDSNLAVMFPPAAAYCQVFDSDKEGGDDEVTDCTWVPDRREEEEGEEEAQAHLQ